MADNCLFCSIVKGEIPCARIYEDDHVLAFEDIHPMAPVHVVVVPKRHISTFMDVSDDTMAYLMSMMTAAQKIAKLKAIDEKGFRTVINCKEEGGQVIFHLHMHLLGGCKLRDDLGQ
ncbi:histidine triad nucleotide-binding protein [Syntrophus aciditrophicus]|uniref:Hit family hydrolase n=1 Tax=Syntrophus aciditrophicus (strain SB) TaxID=56780 RepID=Q2LVF0_SYNAS|nr:histidine triad nucleotide-binding protein [Syntrophus aciditrophicus]ABC78061.1 hit family hydrolase [Syntrophus aciditrophicus SB]OPY18945.1 MAG: HIT-like protein [Syntrophus sp. PtaB.Bin075]